MMKLSPDMIERGVTFIATLATSVEAVEGLTDRELKEAVELGWQVVSGDALPRMFQQRLAQWSGAISADASGPPPPDALAQALLCGQDGEGGGRMPKATPGQTKSVKAAMATAYEAGARNDFPGISARQLEMLVDDAGKQTLSGIEISTLAASIEIGGVMSEDTVLACGLAYGADPRGLAPVKAVSKFDDGTQSKLLKAGNLQGFMSLLTDLARDYTGQGMSQQAVLITAWLAEGMAAFKNDDASFLKYSIAYRRVYCGRGLPVVFDDRMATRARNETRVAEGPSMSKSEMKALVQSELAPLQTANARLQAKVTALEARKPPKNVRDPPGQVRDPAAAAERAAKAKCFNCGKKGHLARDCREPKEDSE